MRQQVRTLSVVEVLKTVNDGGALEDLKEAIAKVSRSVESRGGAGQVTLKLKFSKLGRSQLKITDEVSVTEPKKQNDPTIFFTTQDGELTRQNPDQFPLIDDGAEAHSDE